MIYEDIKGVSSEFKKKKIINCMNIILIYIYIIQKLLLDLLYAWREIRNKSTKAYYVSQLYNILLYSVTN